MDKPTCGTCPYWEQGADKELDIETGDCTRYPPTLVTPDKLSELIEDREFFTQFPKTYDEQSCGEHPDFPAWIESQRAARKGNENV